MNRRMILVATISAVFLPLTAWAIWEVGVLGLFAVAVAGPGEAQVFADLCVALVIVCSFVVRDARERGLAAWPWLLATPFLGSIAPLGYLVYRELSGGR